MTLLYKIQQISEQPKCYNISVKHKNINNKNAEIFNIWCHFYNTSNKKNNNKKQTNNHSPCAHNIPFLVVFVEFLWLFDPLCCCDDLFSWEQCWEEDIFKVFKINKKMMKISVFFFSNTEIVAWKKIVYFSIFNALCIPSSYIRNITTARKQKILKINCELIWIL